MGPLQGLRVVELGHALAGPFGGALLGDFGADVIKIEHPRQGDSLRDMGPKLGENSVWWRVTGRNKRSVCIDFKKPEGLSLVQDLLRTADVLIENFRPGVLDRSGLGWSDLSRLNPRLVMLSISGFGSGGPYSERPGFGKIAEAFSGATHLTGQADAPAVHPGYSLGDATTGLMGAFGVMVALQERDRSGKGQLIDLALYESLLRMIEWQVPLKQMLGWEAHRKGNQFPFEDAFLTDICATADDSDIVVSAATTKALDAIRRLLTDEDVIGPSSGTTAEMAAALRDWVAKRPREEALRLLRERDIVAGPVYSASDIIADEHIAARQNLVSVPDVTGADVLMPNVVPKLETTPGSVRWAGPALGQHSDEVLTECLALSEAELAELRADGVIR
ncbi:CoA transferase [Streptomyces sp. NPDC050388]|uniref:CaiB/BaiF CoA transferase family protein n=1 Tax=Streptomyces sp. NPDC050388 TaxID=3155781 RepID=UPI0034372DC8